MCFDHTFLGLELGKLFPAREGDIPAGNGNPLNLFVCSVSEPKQIHLCTSIYIVRKYSARAVSNHADAVHNEYFWRFLIFFLRLLMSNKDLLALSISRDLIPTYIVSLLNGTVA